MVPSVRQAHAGWDLLIASTVRLRRRVCSPSGISMGFLLKVLIATIEGQKKQRRGRAKPSRPRDASEREPAA